MNGPAPVSLRAAVKRFEDGKLVLEWQYANYLEALTQLHGWNAME